MNKQWKLRLAAGVTCLFAAALPQAGAESAVLPGQAHERNLLNVRVDSDSEGRPVVTLEADGWIEFESFVLDGPDRLVLDLEGTVNRLDRSQVPIGEAGVVKVRAAQHDLIPRPVTRVVFDLEEPLPYLIERESGSLMVVFGEHAGEPVVAQATPLAEIEEPPATMAREDSPVAQLTPVEPVAADVAGEEVASEPVAPPDPTPIEPIEAPTPEPVATESTETEDSGESRSLGVTEIERLLETPSFAAPAESASSGAAPRPSFETRTIVTDAATYSGKRISLNLVDADIKQVFRLFHEISGLNFVLDPDVSGRVTIVLDQVPWDQALDLILKNNGLDKVLDNNVLRIASTQKLAQEAAARKQLKEAEELEVEPITLTRTLSYAKAADVQRVIREGGILSTRGKVIVDERTNTLIISDIPKKMAPVDMLVNTLDTETPQVMIEARIVETSRNYSRSLGITWGFTADATSAHGTATGLAFPNNASAAYALNLPGQAASALGFSFGNVVDSFTLDIELNALETEGQGRILSAPKIATQNNERAEIEQGVRIPIVNTTATEINVEFVSASLRLIVTPQITAEGTVILDVVVENNSPDFVNTAGDIPSIRTQRAQTKVLINDGGTTVIGGIFVVNEGDAETGVPWFRKIPVFGWLFRNQEIQRENRELLIFITPKIMKLA
jgi:type IV pilus assembly protein PilQ